MEPGKRLFIDDGLISVKCTEIGSDHFIGLIENDGNLGSKKGCNLPGTDTDLPAVSEKDKSDLLLGVEQGVDMVFASFIRNADGGKQIRDVLGEKGKNIWVIPKIENQQGIKNLTEIIACSEGLMVARGDMGPEDREPAGHQEPHRDHRLQRGPYGRTWRHGPRRSRTSRASRTSPRSSPAARALWSHVETWAS